MRLTNCLSLLIASIIAAPAIAEDWSGAYVTGIVGFGADETETRNAAGDRIPTEPDPDGPLVGFGGGYNWQQERLVYGIEADLMNGPSGTGRDGADRYPLDVNWLATLRGRVGYDYGAFMPYFTAGLAMADTEFSYESGGASDSDTGNGWIVGFGFEYSSGPRWTYRGEFLYGEIDTEYDIGSGVEVEHTISQARYGVSYRF